MPGLNTIKAYDAHNRSITGSGITVGVIDTGVDASHSEFAGRITGCYNAATGLSGCNNVVPMTHATHVTGTIAAAKDGAGVLGVAYNANILNADIFNGSSSSVGSNLEANAVNWTVSHGADVTSNSYGMSPHDQYSVSSILSSYNNATPLGQAYTNAVNHHVIMVWAAGNDHASQPILPAALPLYFPQWKDDWVVVTSVATDTGALASYANKCGDTATFCIAAPGGDYSDGGIYSTLPNGGYGYLKGTSMATPHVSGAVALLLEEFGPGTPSNKTPEQVVDIMFATANKTGIYANATTYGQGLLDLERATRPDAATLAFNNAALVDTTSLEFGPAFGDAPASVLHGQMAGAVDKFDRVFMVDLGTLAKETPAGTDTYKLIRHFGAQNMSMVSLPSGTLAFSFTQPSAYEKTAPQIEQFSLHSELTPHISMNTFYGMKPGTQLGLYTDIYSGNVLNHSLLSAHEQSINPYFDLGGDREFGTGIELQSKARLKIRSLAFMSQPKTRDPYPTLFTDRAEDEKDAVAGAAVETETRINSRLALSFTAGAVREDKTILGTTHTGGFATEDDTYTIFAGPSARYRLTEDISLIGSWQSGWTGAKNAQDSLFSNFSEIRSDSFTVGVVGTDLARRHDKWGILVHQPLRVSGAAATLSLPQGYNDAGEMQYRHERVDLTPAGRELNLQTFYTVEYEHNKTFSAGLMYRSEPGHDPDRNAEGIAMVRFGIKF